MALVCASAMLLIGGEPPRLTAEQFGRIMHGLHAPIRDVTFIFEGKMFGLPIGITVAEALEGGETSKARLNMDFQGAYAVRSDGASYIDAFDNDHSNSGIDHTRRLAANLRSELKQVTRFPERRNEQGITEGGGPGTLNRTGSPERINYLYFFMPLEDYAARNFRHLGWEEVDGHRCAVVQLDISYGDKMPDGERIVNQYWVDLERGGHPLRVDFLHPKEGLRMRSLGIELAQVDFPGGKEIWFPVRGRTEFFSNMGWRKPGDPEGVETYSVVGGTIRFNQDLPDSAFSIERDFPGSEGLDPLRKKFRVPVPRNDPRGIKERLERKLAKANATSPEIRVEPTTSTGWGRIALVVAGCLSLIAGFWFWRRSSR